MVDILLEGVRILKDIKGVSQMQIIHYLPMPFVIRQIKSRIQGLRRYYGCVLSIGSLFINTCILAIMKHQYTNYVYVIKISSIVKRHNISFHLKMCCVTRR